MNNFILIVDDNQDFINELRTQANALEAWKDNCLLICFDQDDTINVLEHHAQQITSVFLDFYMRDKDGKPFGADQFMEATKEYLDWDKVRCFWFSGDEDLDRETIQPAKAKFSRLDTAYIRKPFSFLQLVARLEKHDNIPQWQGFPLPLRVINKQAQVIYSNEHWRIASNEPVPELFVNNGVFDKGERDFYGRHPDGNITTYPKFNHFRLISSDDESGQYLLQFAQGLAGLEKTQERNQLKQLIEKICLALNGHGFKRVRLYRYYSVPRHYEENEKHEDTQIKGFMPLYYSNTNLRFSDCSCDSCATPERGNRIGEKIKEVSEQSEKLIYDIDNEAEPKAECDINTIPEDAENSQSVLEMPLITQFKEITDITKKNLLGLLVIDRYDEQTHRYTPITEEDVRRLKDTLLAYCRVLTYSLEQEIKDNDRKTKIDYANFDQEFLTDLQNPEELLKHLLDKAINTSGATVGYITEPYQSESYKITISTNHTLFQGYVFSNQAIDLPVVRCWKTGKSIALPNLREEVEITENIVIAYDDEKMVWQSEKDKTVPDGDEIRDYLKNKIGSMVALPVFVNNEQIASIILHAKQPYHFNYEKLNSLHYLITRVGLILMAARRVQWKLFLDGVIHEIKSDISPLKQALNSLEVDKHNSIYLRAQYCVTRLDMASKNLLLMTQDKELDLDKTSFLSKVLPEICELYQQTINEKKISLLFEPEQDNKIWSTPITMSIEWLTHIIANLLDNAVKYTKSRGTITISTQSNNQQFILQVINSGNMNQQELASVFNADFRSKQGSGFHVGLASCKKIMQAHQGDIELKNIAEKIQVTVTWLLANSKMTGEQS